MPLHRASDALADSLCPVSAVSQPAIPPSDPDSAPPAGHGCRRSPSPLVPACSGRGLVHVRAASLPPCPLCSARFSVQRRHSCRRPTRANPSFALQFSEHLGFDESAAPSRFRTCGSLTEYWLAEQRLPRAAFQNRGRLPHRAPRHRKLGMHSPFQLLEARQLPLFRAPV